MTPARRLAHAVITVVSMGLFTGAAWGGCALLERGTPPLVAGPVAAVVMLSWLGVLACLISLACTAMDL